MWKIAITLLALLPSLWMIGQAGAIPHLGYFHDDGLYAGTAAALADGRGLVVESLPGEPWQVKYPPLFPLYLALGVSREWALLLEVWILLPVLLVQLWRWRGDPLLVFLAGWNVYTVVFSGTALSELFATVLLLESIRLLETDRIRPAALVAGMAYLSRTALVALPAGAILWLLLLRRWRDAAIFAGLFSPFFLGWTAWVAAHTPAGLTGNLVYYLSYTQFFRENMDWGIFPLVLSANFQGLVGSLGGVLFFNSGDSFWEINFARVLLFGAIAGQVRLFQRHGWRPYPLMALFYMVLLLVWNYIPNERFLFPLLPLLLEGLLNELRQFSAMLRTTWHTQRTATVILGGLAAAGCLWMVQRNAVAAWVYSPSIPRNYREMAPDRAKAYEWIRRNTPPDANFLAYEDPALRRGTGRHAIGIHCPTRLFYTNDMAGIFAWHKGLVTGMPDAGLQYLIIGPSDLAQDIQALDRQKILDDWRTRSDLETVYTNDRFMVRRLRKVQSGM